MNQAFDAAALDSAVLDTLDAALRPLARLAVRHQIGLRRLEELLKLALVREAEASLPDGERATDSHIHVLTGMHRRDVARLRAGASQAQGEGARHSLARRVLARWTGDAGYIDEEGQPVPLATTEREGGRLSFEALVRSLSTHVGYRSLLDEWQRAGALLQADDGSWRLQITQATQLMPLEQRLRMTGLRLYDIGLSLVDDLVGERPRHFHMFADESALTPRSARLLTEHAHEVGRKALISFNAKAMALARQDRGRPDATLRATFGAFTRTADDDPAAPAAVRHLHDGAGAPARTRAD